MLKEKFGRALPALAALLVLGTSLVTSAQAGVTMSPTRAYAGSHTTRELSSGNAAEWIGAVGAAVAGATAVAAATAEESTVVIIIILAATHHALTPAQRASYAHSFDH